MVGKKILSLGLIVALVGALSGCSSPKEKDENVKEIGIMQIVEHPALDASREGFIQALKDKNYVDGENIKINYQNAQGDTATIETIGDEFVSNNDDLIFAVATPAAQAAYNATQKWNKNIPIVTTAVTDPVSAGIVNSLEKPGTNVTGTSDDAPIDAQFNLIKKLIPTAKRIGILYNTSEVNSEIQVQKAKEVAKSFGFEVVAQGISAENEIPQSLQSILNKIDVFLVIKDNTIASAMSTVTKECFDKKIPVMGSESAHVKGGAIATDGIDYYKLGYETGLKAVEILEGKDPAEIPVEMQKDSSIMINEDSAKRLNINIPEDISKKAEFVSGGEK